jgi:type VI secretion system lysozyme-like protein
MMPSVLDRLLDPELIGRADVPGYTEREMLRAVRADLEDLLNTRQSVFDVPDDCPETAKSILCYGLPDVISDLCQGVRRFAPPGGPIKEADVANGIERAITTFEPRLTRVKVKVIGGVGVDKTVRFHIDALLNVDPVTGCGFETVVELISGRARVRTDGGGG